MINVYCTWGIQQFVTFLGKVIYIYMYNFMYDKHPAKVKQNQTFHHNIKSNLYPESGAVSLFTLGILLDCSPSPPCVCVHGGGNGGVYVSGGGVADQTHTHTRPYTSPPGDWAPYIQPSNPLLHKATTATQASLLPVARQQAPEPHHRVSLGHGCTWKCSNGSVRTKEKRQTRKTRGNTPPIKHVCGIVQICAQHNVHNEVCESGRTEWGKRMEEDDLWSFCQKTFFPAEWDSSCLNLQTYSTIASKPSRGFRLCWGFGNCGGKCTHSCF